MTDNNSEVSAQLRDIKSQVSALAQFLLSMRDVPQYVQENVNRLDRIEDRINKVTLNELDQIIESLQYSAIKSENAAKIYRGWKPSFILGVICAVAFGSLGYITGLKQGIPSKQSQIEFAEKFKSIKEKDNAEWTIANPEIVKLVRDIDENDLRWLNSATARYAKKFFQVNGFLVNGECPATQLQQRQVNGRTLCSIWKVDPS